MNQGTREGCQAPPEEDRVTEQPHEPATPSADSPTGGGRGRPGIIGLLSLAVSVALLLLFMLALFNGGTGPTR